MHVIESSFLVPLGLALIALLLMLTFYLHDQTVLTAEYSAFVLEWQERPGELPVDRKDSLTQISDRLLITGLSVESLKAGSTVCRIKTEETHRLFEGVLSLLEVGFDAEEERTFTYFKLNPYWVKRIWKVAVEE